MSRVPYLPTSSEDRVTPACGIVTRVAHHCIVTEVCTNPSQMGRRVSQKDPAGLGHDTNRAFFFSFFSFLPSLPGRAHMHASRCLIEGAGGANRYVGKAASNR